MSEPKPKLEYETPPPKASIGSYFRRLGPAGPLAIIASTFPPIGGFVLLGLVTRIAPWLREHRTVGLIIFIGGFALSAALSMLPTYACSILAGWSFGFAVGFPACVVAFTLASLFAWIVNSLAAGDRVLEIIHEHPKWDVVRKALIGQGFWKSFLILTLVRIPPTSPFALLNFIAATTRAPLGAYLLATIVGMSPRTAVVVWAASHASQLDFDKKGSGWSLAIAIALTVAVVAIISHIANKAIKSVTGSKAQESA